MNLEDMSLGERIYQYRTKKGLSQGDLAEKLNVSRQSISKWENNMAVPDLDKIIKLGEIFEVSLDELVKGAVFEADIPEQEDTKDAKASSEKKEAASPRKNHRLLGMILLGMAFLIILCGLLLNGFLLSLFVSVPFLLCGILCLVLKESKNVGLWCAWTIYLLLMIYLTWATGVTWKTIFMTLYWTPSMNIARLVVAWILFLLLLILVKITVKRFSKATFCSLKKGIYTTVFGWFTYGSAYFVAQWIYKCLVNSIITGGAMGGYRLLRVWSIVFDILKLPLFTFALIDTVRLIKTIKASTNK